MPLKSNAMTKILFVCTANVCRSPMALTVARKLIKERGLARTMQVDSAGTHAPLPPQRPDPRAVATLERRGYKPERMRSSRIGSKHFVDFDWVLAMDMANMAALAKVCPAEHAHKIRLLMTYAPETGRTEVPDPYYGNAQGFELVLDLCEAAINALLKHQAL